MTKRRIALGLSLSLAACGPGTEIADAGTDAVVPDDSILDGGQRDALVPTDASSDAFVAITPDAGVDAPVEPTFDAGMDAGPDAAVVFFDDVTLPDAFIPPDAFVPTDTFVAPDAFRAFPMCSAPDLAVSSSPTPPPLVISEIDPGTFLELYNTTSADIALSSVPYQFCSPFVYAAVATVGSGITIPAHGYANLPWPSGFSDTEAGGEISLYTSGAYGDPSAVMSFVCWGTNPHGTRKTTAEMGGRWSGACASAITAGRSIARRPSTTGTLASDWATDATPSPERCAP